MTDRATTDLSPDATDARPKSRWEPSASRYAQTLLPPAEAGEAVELAVVCAEFEGSVDDRELIRSAIRAAVANRLTHSASAPAGGTHRECAGIPELLLARSRGGVSEADQAQLGEHLAWCDRCRELEQRIQRAELAFDAPLPPAGRFRRAAATAPASVAAPPPEPTVAAPPHPAAPEPLPPELAPPPPPTHVDPEFDASAPATTVAIPRAQEDVPPSTSHLLSRDEPVPSGGRVSRRLAGVVAAALFAVCGIAVAAVLRSGGAGDSEPARSVVTPAPKPPPQLDREPSSRQSADRAAADRAAARERRRAAERRRRQAAERRERSRSQTTQPQSTTPSPPPAAPVTTTPQATTPAPRRNTPPPRRRRPPPPPATQPSAPDNPVPSPPADAPGRQPPS